MRIGLFTDTYFPQVSGVSTSICTLKEELEKEGHEVYIFTTTDKAVKRYEDPTIIRLPSVPFVSFTDRRVVYRGCGNANASGGVVYAHASSDASFAGANVGSRLAFRGQIVWAQSVSAFKSISEVA